MRRSATTTMILAVLPGISCGGPQIQVRPLVHLQPRPVDSAVYVFVREETPPACPWEVVGSIAADAGWLDRETERDDVEEAVRTMGGQGILLLERNDPEADVIRFLDPISLCDPLVPAGESDG